MSDIGQCMAQSIAQPSSTPKSFFEDYCDTIVLLGGKSLVLILKYFEIEMCELVLIRVNINFVSQIHLNQLSLAFD